MLYGGVALEKVLAGCWEGLARILMGKFIGCGCGGVWWGVVGCGGVGLGRVGSGRVG